MGNSIFKVGQVVFINGLYRARIIYIFEKSDDITCKVYEGLAPGVKNDVYTYKKNLLTTKRSKKRHG